MSHPDTHKYEDDSLSFQLNSRQNAIKNYLDQHLSELGSMYYGALFTLNQNHNPESLVQAAHSIRELIKQLPKITPTISINVPKLNSNNKIKEFLSRIEKDPNLLNENFVKSYFNKVLEDSSFYHRTLLGEFLDNFGQVGLPAEDKERAAKNLLDIYKWFVNVCHHRITTSFNEMQKQINRLEIILEVLFKPHYGVEKIFNKLLEVESPNEDDLNELKSLLIKKARIESWFRNLKNCKWLQLLKNANYFKAPIDIIEHKDGSISCPSWPQTTYLIHCANENPELISKILQEVQETRNPRVHQELIEIALLLPVSYIKDFAKQTKKWIRDKYQTITLLPIKLAEFAAQLASQGELSISIEMAYTILDVQIDEKKYSEQQNDSGFSLVPEANAYVESWNYRKMIEILRSKSEIKNSLEFIKLLCDKLSKAIRIEFDVRGESRKDIDYTYISRPAIGDHEQNSGTDRLKDVLISQIRDSVVEATNNGISVDKLFEILDSYSYPIFKRLSIHLMLKYPELCKSHIASTLTNFDNFGCEEIHHEFYKLLENCFDLLAHEDKETYYNWIKAGPNLEVFRKNTLQFSNQEPSENEINEYIEEWKLRKYSPIKSALNKENEEVYNTLIKKYKTNEHPEFTRYRMSWVGPKSPLSYDDFKEMEINEVFEYLYTWEPTDRMFAPSPEGLGRVLKDNINERAFEYSKFANEIDLNKIQPVYLAYFFTGLEQAIKEKKSIDWSCVLDLTEVVIFNDELPLPDKKNDNFEYTWVSVRRNIASLMHESLKSIDLIPFSFKEQVWRTIDKLCNENEPSLDYENQYGGSNMSPVDMSINTVRGEAVHSLFHYLIWVDNNENKGKDKKSQKHSIPDEAKKKIESLLDTTIEPTLTIRSVIGLYFQWVAFLDIKYTQKILNQIFPIETEKRSYREAAFEGYFSFNSPDAYLFQNTRSVFVRAFDWANGLTEDESFHKPKFNYIEHLIVLYWWGIEPLEDNSLINFIFTKGNVKLRSHAIEFIGRKLETLLPVVKGGPEALQRLQELLNWRLEELINADISADEKAEEIKEFGWWFTYAQMEKEWLIEKLINVLTITRGEIEWTHEVLRRLNEFVPIDSVKVASAVNLIVRFDSSPWNIQYWEEHLLKIFNSIKESDKHEAWKISETTINFLGEHGHRSFGKLLDF